MANLSGPCIEDDIAPFLEILFNKNLSSASFLLEPYHVDPRSCILSDLLKIPLVTMTDVHSGLCQNVISMRPSPEQLFRILNEFINEDKPQRVGVIVEGKYCMICLILCTYKSSK